MSRRIASVAVVGRDAPLWLAAASLQRALGRSGVRVQAVDLGMRLTEADAYLGLPALASLHRLLGIDERLVLEACRAVPMAGQRFADWGGAGSTYTLAYDDEPPVGELSFLQFWAKGTLKGLRVGLEEFSLGTACTRLNCVPAAPADATGLSASYGYHLDGRSYAAVAKQLAARLGVEIAGSPARRIDASGDRIDAIELADGGRLEADLYIDASGSEAMLLGQLASAKFESWAAWLPCDRMLVASGPRLPQLPAFSQVSACRGGWVGQFPLQDRTAIAAVYTSSAVSDSDMLEITRGIAGTMSGDAVVSPLRPGRQQSPWIGNCVAIGEAAIAADPVDGVGLQLAHGCMSHLITLFPATAEEFPEAESYNRVIRRFATNVRDFQAAHYVLNRRVGEPMWDKARDCAPPPGLKRKIDMFSARAIIPLDDDETFHEAGWAALLNGCGVRPNGYDPRIDSVPDDLLIARVQQRLRDVASLARQMPSVQAFLALEQSTIAQVGR